MRRFEVYKVEGEKEGTSVFVIMDYSQGCWCRQNGGYDGEFIEFNSKREANRLSRKWNKGIDTPSINPQPPFQGYV